MSHQTHTDIETWLDSVDPSDLQDASDLRAVAEAADARPYADEPVVTAVAAAREAGRTWAEIGLALGMSRQSAHARFAERVGEAVAVELHVRVVERGERRVIEAELRTKHAPAEATFSMRVSREPFGFGHSLTGSLSSGEPPRFVFPDSWHGRQTLQAGQYEVGGEVRMGQTVLEDVQRIVVS